MSSKPHITLKIGGSGSFSSQLKSPAVGTPTPGGGPKLKLNLGGGSKPTTPNEPVPKPIQKTKAGRAPRPSAKAVANKNGKRRKDESDDEDTPLSVAKRRVAEAGRPSKKLKMSIGGIKVDVASKDAVKTPTVLKAKFKGKPPKRPLGEGYDSEASDREEDPVIEEEFVLRMIPGDDCEYLRRMIDEKKIGIPRKEGGADIQMKFLHPEGRRAVVTIRGRHYAATLVDLPCIIEGMKSWDKKGWYKSGDICQMLLVFAQVPQEVDALTVSLPKIVDPNTFQYPHGITPPMHFARKRRFRKRISRTAIEAVENAVDKLLADDARAESTRHEMIDPEGGSRNGSRAFSESSPGPFGDEDQEYSEDEDAEGEADDTNNYFSQAHHTEQSAPPLVGEEADDDLAADLEADLEAALQEEFDIGTPASSQAIVDSPDIILTNGGTPDANRNVGQGSGDESSDVVDDDDDDDDDAEGEDEEVDEDERARLAQLQGAKEDIAEMERQLANLENQMATQANPILKRRIKDNIDKVKAELQLKKSAIGEADDD
jgi:transcription initiation factor TFIID subunit 7